MASKSFLHQLQDAVVDTVKGAVKDPVGTAKGTIAVGRWMAGQVARSAARRVPGLTSEPPARPVAVPDQPVSEEPDSEQPAQPVEVTPTDVARIVAKKAPTKKAPPSRSTAKKAPAKKAPSPSGKLPAKKAPAKKAPAKKTTAAKATAAKATAAKAPAKTAAPPTAAEVIEDAATEVTTPVGTTGADVATNPDTTDTDLQQPGTEPLVDPATTRAVASEAETGARAADPKKG